MEAKNGLITGSLRVIGKIFGTVTEAEKLQNSHSIQTNLGLQASASFDGTNDISPGVTGTLKIANGGTGATTGTQALKNLGALGAKTANSYIGMTDQDNNDNTWIRTTSLGLIPYQSGGATAGHSSLGTSSWYFGNAYIQTTHGSLDGNATSSTYPQGFSSRSNTFTWGTLGSGNYTKITDWNANGGEISFAETGGKLSVQIDGKFFQDEGANEVLGKNDVVNNLTSSISNAPLSALQGKTLKDTMDAITIGGRNLVRNTTFIKSQINAKDSAYQTLHTGAWKSWGVTIEKDGSTGIKVTFPAGASTTDWGVWQDIEVQKNTNYTLSMIVKGDTRVLAGPTVTTSVPWSGTGSFSTDNKANYTFISKTFNTGDKTNFRIILAVMGTKTAYYRDIKLEKGNRSTDWTPAPEDLVFNDGETNLAPVATKLSQSYGKTNIPIYFVDGIPMQIDSYGGTSNRAIGDKNGLQIDTGYLKLDGTNTMTGALKLANGTWNVAGDDADFGDNNTAGSFAIRGKNGNTNLKMVGYGNTNYALMTYDGSNQIAFSSSTGSSTVKADTFDGAAKYATHLAILTNNNIADANNKINVQASPLINYPATSSDKNTIAIWGQSWTVPDLISPSASNPSGQMEIYLTTNYSSNKNIVNANLKIDGSITAEGGFIGNASSATNATNASYATRAGNATYATNANYATNAGTANSVAWGNIASKPYTFKAYSGALNANGWKTLQGRGTSPVLTVAYNNNPASWNSSTYSASLVWGSSDTRGLLDCGYASPQVTFGGASNANSTDNDPKWYMSLTGTTATTYNLDNLKSKITDGSRSLSLNSAGADDYAFGQVMTTKAGNSYYLYFNDGDNIAQAPEIRIYGRNGNANAKILTTRDTITVAQGGTGKTTIKAARNNLLSSLEDQSTNVISDGTKFIGYYLDPTDSNGGAYFRTASSIWTYTQGKADSRYLQLSGGTLTGQLYIKLDQDVGLNQNGSLIIGNKAGANIGIDGNEIMARNNSKAATLYINNEGGTISSGGNFISKSIQEGEWITGTHKGSFGVTEVTSATAGNSFQSWFSGKTKNGSWGIGQLSGYNDLYFVYGTDANYNAKTNITKQVKLPSGGDKNGLTTITSHIKSTSDLGANKDLETDVIYIVYQN